MFYSEIQHDDLHQFFCLHYIREKIIDSEEEEECEEEIKNEKLDTSRSSLL